MSGHQRGEARHSARLTESQVLEIRARHAAGELLIDLHRAFPQCSKPNLHHIVTGKRWRYLLSTPPPTTLPGVWRRFDPHPSDDGIAGPGEDGFFWVEALIVLPADRIAA